MRPCGLLVNGVDLGTQFGFVCADPDGFLSQLTLTYPTDADPAGVAHRVLRQAPEGTPRELRLVGHVLADSLAALTAQLDGLKAWVTNGTVQVVSAFAPTRYFEALATGVQVLNVARPFRQPTPRVTIAFTCPDPHAWASALTTVPLSAVAASCSLGSAPSMPVITVTGIHSNLALTLRTAAGVVRETMTLTLSLPGAADTLVIDTARKTVRSTIGGVGANAIQALTGGAFPTFLRLDPRDGDLLAGTFPTLEATVASGAPTITATYRQRYR